MILLPKYTDLYTNKPLVMGVKYKGEFNITMRDINGKFLYETGWFDNILTDNGLDNIGGSNPLIQVTVGSDNTPAAITDVALGTFLGFGAPIGSNVYGNTGTPDYAVTGIFQYRFAAGVATGTIQEIGLGTQSNGTDLTIRSIISPAIVKAADQIMDITHKRYVYRDYVAPAYPTGTIDISGVTYNYEIRASEVSYAMLAGMGGINVAPTVHATTGELVDPWVTPGPAKTDVIARINGTKDAYTLGSYQNSISGAFSVSQGNHVNGIRSILFTDVIADSIDLGPTINSRSSGFIVRLGKVSDDTAIMKTSDQTFSITATRSWGRYP